MDTCVGSNVSQKPRLGPKYKAYQSFKKVLFVYYNGGTEKRSIRFGGKYCFASAADVEGIIFMTLPYNRFYKNCTRLVF